MTVLISQSFADPRRLSAPEIQGSHNTLQTLTIPPPTTPSFSGLVRHLHDQLHPYLIKKQDEGVVLNAFVTFIVGPPDHPNARFALHSHLVGCHTTCNSDMHVDYSTIYIPSGPGQPWAGPEEWGPLMVFIAAALLYPFLSATRDFCWGPTPPWTNSAEFSQCNARWCCSLLQGTSHALMSFITWTDLQICTQTSFQMYRPTVSPQ